MARARGHQLKSFIMAPVKLVQLEDMYGIGTGPRRKGITTRRHENKYVVLLHGEVPRRVVMPFLLGPVPMPYMSSS